MAGVVYAISFNLPDVDSINTMIPNETTKIFSDNNTVLAELHQEENRIIIPLENISKTVQQTVVALEDTEFYSHHGINFKALLRALIKDIKAGSFVEGGSTLTQQLARNLFLTKKKHLMRKAEEAILAVQIERKYSKPDILEMYLNQVYWGHNAYGIESAARLYFGKSADSVSLAESAMLVGLLKGPELYSPFKDFKRAKDRQKTVLQRMVRVKLITDAQAQEAYEEKLDLAKRKKYRFKAPYFTSYIVNQLIQKYGEEAVYTSGMRVYTTLNYDLEMAAERIVKKYVDMANEPQYVKGSQVPSLNMTQAAILAIEPSTGYIKILQGGVDFSESEFNHCIQARRQPGSAFKPFVYLAALERGFTPSTLVQDTPITFNTFQGPYSPQNFTLTFLGSIPLRKALELSVNVVAIKLNDLIGPKNVVRVARQLGIKSPLQPVLSLPLGANDVTMLEITSAYGVLANGGRRVEPTGIIRIEDRDGTPLYENKIHEKRVFDENLIYTLVDMMKGVVTRGTGRNALLPRPIAGKTGTTSDYRDAWFIGFVPQLACAVWVGNDNNSPMVEMTGGWMPALMWNNIMKEALRKIPAQDFPRPKNYASKQDNWQIDTAPEDTNPDPVYGENYWKAKTATANSVIAPVSAPQAGSTEENILDFFGRH